MKAEVMLGRETAIGLGGHQRDAMAPAAQADTEADEGKHVAVGAHGDEDGVHGLRYFANSCSAALRKAPWLWPPLPGKPACCTIHTVMRPRLVSTFMLVARAPP